MHENSQTYMCTHTTKFNISTISKRSPCSTFILCLQLTSQRPNLSSYGATSQECSLVVWKCMYRIYLSITEQTWLLSPSQRHMIVLINLPLWAWGTAARALVAALSKQNNAMLSFPHWIFHYKGAPTTGLNSWIHRSIFTSTNVWPLKRKRDFFLTCFIWAWNMVRYVIPRIWAKCSPTPPSSLESKHTVER